jgi:hypothetical protein
MSDMAVYFILFWMCMLSIFPAANYVRQKVKYW